MLPFVSLDQCHGMARTRQSSRLSRPESQRTRLRTLVTSSARSVREAPSTLDTRDHGRYMYPSRRSQPTPARARDSAP